MMRWTVLGILSTLAACGNDSPPSGAAPKGSVDSNGGRYRISFRTLPEPIPLNQPFTLRFQVSPTGPGPRSVEVDARMPAHGHGMNRVAKVARLPDGAFEASGLVFHMPGHWELYVDIAEGGRTERAQIDVELK